MIIQVIDDNKVNKKGYRGYDELNIDVSDITVLSNMCRLIGGENFLYHVTNNTLKKIKRLVNQGKMEKCFIL